MFFLGGLEIGMIEKIGPVLPWFFWGHPWTSLGGSLWSVADFSAPFGENLSSWLCFTYLLWRILPANKTEWSCVTGTSLHLLKDTLIALFCLGKCRLWKLLWPVSWLGNWGMEIMEKWGVQKETKNKKKPCKRCVFMWRVPKIGVPQNGWFIMENPIKMDDLGGKPTIFGNPPSIAI